MSEQVELPDVPELCERLVEQLDDRTRGDLRLLIFALGMNFEEDVEGTREVITCLFDQLEPPRGKSADNQFSSD